LSDPKEAGIFTALAPPGQFTSIVAGRNGGIGIALVEIYNLKSVDRALRRAMLWRWVGRSVARCFQVPAKPGK